MKQHVLTCAAALLSAACHPTPSTQNGSAAQTIEVSSFEQPESALHDVADDVYLVSNVAGSPFEKDGRGFISRVGTDGKVLNLTFIAGLDAPKGMAIHGDTLAVSDLTVLRRFDRASGRPLDVIDIEGATFLNDVAAGSDGSFYVTDSGFRQDGEGVASTGSEAIYRVAPDGSVQRIAQGAALSFPNGLAIAGEDLWMVPFGAAKVFRFALDGQLREELAAPAGQLDGVLALPNGCLWISSWQQGALLTGHVGEALAPSLGVMAADLGIDEGRKLLLLPLMAENKLQIVPLATIAGACK